MTIEDRIKAIMAKVLKVAPTAINDDTAPRTVEGWDSLTHMNLMAALEKEFDIDFSDEEFEEMINYRIIVAVISSYLED